MARAVGGRCATVDFLGSHARRLISCARGRSKARRARHLPTLHWRIRVQRQLSCVACATLAAVPARPDTKCKLSNFTPHSCRRPEGVLVLRAPLIPHIFTVRETKNTATDQSQRLTPHDASPYREPTQHFLRSVF